MENHLFPEVVSDDFSNLAYELFSILYVLLKRRTSITGNQIKDRSSIKINYGTIIVINAFAKKVANKMSTKSHAKI